MPEETSSGVKIPEASAPVRASRQAPVPQKAGNDGKPERTTQRRNARPKSSDVGGEEKVLAIKAVVAAKRFIVVADVGNEVQVHTHWS